MAGTRQRSSIRVVAALAVAVAVLCAPGSAAASPGDIYVVTSHPGVQACGGGGCTITRIDPDSGAITPFANFPAPLQSPDGLALTPRGDFLVGLQNGVTGRSGLYRVDQQGAAGVVAEGPPFIDPSGIAVEADGDYLVTDEVANALFRVNAISRAVTTVAAGPPFQLPSDVTVEDDGDIYVTDRSGSVFEVDPRNGARATITSPGLLESPTGIATTAGDEFYVSDEGELQPPRIFRVELGGGGFSIRSGAPFVNLMGVALEASGDLVSADFFGSGTVWRTDPENSATTAVATNLPSGPVAIEVEPPKCRGRSATVVGSPGKDKLVGSRENDVIVGLGGKDVLKGGKGHDWICGGTGNDRITGSGGRDRCFSGKGKDSLSKCERPITLYR